MTNKLWERDVNESEALKQIAGIVGAWQRTPMAVRYSTEVMRQEIALRDIAAVLRHVVASTPS
jgi:hypothetical protein